jgi:hypothetical protein
VFKPEQNYEIATFHLEQNSVERSALELVPELE